MIRQLAGHQLVPPEKNFRWRGGEITRLEALTDAVFALAVTLLIVSLEVPRTFAHLALTMKGFLAFAVCFALLMQVWHSHYIYSRRYGLQTPSSVFLNSVLLFVVLFYVYPLKFLFTLTIGALAGSASERELRQMIDIHQIPALVMIFSLGFAAVFAVFFLLYRYAYGKRCELELNQYEILRTRHDMVNNAVTCCTGMLVAVTANLLPFEKAFLAMFVSFLSPIYVLISRPILRRREKLALERVQAASRAATS